MAQTLEECDSTCIHCHELEALQIVQVVRVVVVVVQVAHSTLRVVEPEADVAVTMG